MRYYEFLIEYDRSKTANAFGTKLVQKMLRDPSLVNFQPLAVAPRLLNVTTAMIANPDIQDNISLQMPTGSIATVNAQNAEQIKQQAVPLYLNALLEALETGDPTKNKQYVQWLTKMYANTNIKLEDIVSTTKEYLTKFELLKRKKLIQPPANDINKYPSIQNFMDVLDTYDLPEEEAAVNKGSSEEVYKDANVRVIVPEDQPAACYYGRGTRWCTAATQGSNYFDHYNHQGKLYILLPMKPGYEGEKYQLHFPSGQFMDETDSQIDIINLLTERFPGLKDFFMKAEPEIQSLIAFAPDDVLAPILYKIREFGEEILWDQMNEWETNDDYFREWQEKEGRERGYLLKDNGEPWDPKKDEVPEDEDEDEYLEGLDTDWDRIYEDSDLNDYMDYNDEARTYYRDTEGALNLSPSEIREYTQELMSNGDIDEAYISNLDEIVSRKINDDLGISSYNRRESSPVADAISAKLSVRFDKHTGAWQVTRYR